MGIDQIKIILSFSGSIIIFLLGNYVFLKDPKRKLNKIFFIFSIFGTVWELSYALFRLIYSKAFLQIEQLIGTKEVLKMFILLEIWNAGGFFLSSIFLHLCLLITEKEELLKKKIVKFFIYFPPISFTISGTLADFSFMILGRHLFTGASLFLFNTLSGIFFESYLFIALFLLLKRYFSLRSFQEKVKLRYFLIGASIPSLLGSIFTIILPAIFKINIFSWLTYPFYTLGYVFVGIGVLKYGLFIDYREILENIFKKLNELVIISDKKGIILLTNEITPEKLGYEKKEIIGKKMEDILKGGKKRWEEILNRIKEFGPILEEKTIFLTKKKEEAPYLLNSSQGKEGLIFVGRDIKEIIGYQERLEKEVRERTMELEEAKSVLEIKVKARTKELSELAQSLEEKVREKTKELQEKLEELEKFQKITVERELKMVELKKEIEKLKEELSKKGREIRIQEYGKK
jgi:PAS domain S-box-containing protein